jgi:hypothetical protein
MSLRNPTIIVNLGIIGGLIIQYYRGLSYPSKL